MPVKSKVQFAAMQVAAHGKSALGIPKKVGKEFVKGGMPMGMPKKSMPKAMLKKMESKTSSKMKGK